MDKVPAALDILRFTPEATSLVHRRGFNGKFSALVAKSEDQNKLRTTNGRGAGGYAGLRLSLKQKIEMQENALVMKCCGQSKDNSGDLPLASLPR